MEYLGFHRTREKNYQIQYHTVMTTQKLHLYQTITD